MIDFQTLDPANKAQYDKFLKSCGHRGCEYSFANLYLWGRQKTALLYGHMVFFSQFNRRSVYLFPVGEGDKKPVLDALMADAAQRGIPLRLTGLLPEDCETVEALYPGRFRFHPDRDGYDYVYDINDLAGLKGKKYQKKRNHLNRFLERNPYHMAQPITEENLPLVREMVEQWYREKAEEVPDGDYYMEKAAIFKALEKRTELGMEGYALLVDGACVAMSMASCLSDTTLDVHFEKALNRAEDAYAAINFYFSGYLREKYPASQWLNREDDMGLEGLRKAKMSYRPDHMIEKSWACLLEDCYDY